MERRRFTREFKVEAVKLVRERGVAVRQAALAAYHQFKGKLRNVAPSDGMSGAFLGPQYSKRDRAQAEGGGRAL
jgi:hypothetical protein